MRSDKVRIIVINLVFIMVASLFVGPFTTFAFANNGGIQTQADEKILRIGEKEYTLTENNKTASGTGWACELNIWGTVDLTLEKSYTGEKIYCNNDLNIIVDGKVNINATDSIGIEGTNRVDITSKQTGINSLYNGELSVSVSGNYPAIKSATIDFYRIDAKAYSTGSKALETGNLMYDFSGEIIKVGDSEATAIEGKYVNQKFVHFNLIDYTMNLNGNGVKTSENEEIKVIKFNETSTQSLYLNECKNYFTKTSEIQIGWTKIKDDYKNVIQHYETYGYNKTKLEDTLYALWTSGSVKAVTLEKYNDNEVKDVSKIYPVKNGEDYVLPKMNKGGAKFLYWTDGSSQYTAETRVKIDSNKTFTANYEALKAKVGGKVIDATVDESTESWWYYISNSNEIVLRLYSNYGVGDVELPGDSTISLYGIKNLVGSTSSSAITVDGNVTIEILYGDNEFCIIEGNGAPAINAKGTITFSNGVIYAGNSEDTAVEVSAYTNQSYVKIVKKQSQPFNPPSGGDGNEGEQPVVNPEPTTPKKEDDTTKETREDGVVIETKKDESGNTSADVVIPDEMPVTKVQIPAELGEKEGVVFVEVKYEDGTTNKVMGTYKDGKLDVNVEGTATVKVLNEVIPYVETPKFEDISEHWAKDSIEIAAQLGVFKGKSDNEYAPDDNMTREQMFMVLSRLKGEGKQSMEEAMKWAIDNGISDGSNPKGDVTREQFITLLWRASGERKSTYDLAKYSDAEKVSSWAKDAFAWALEIGLVNGTTADTLSPKGYASRAQLATIIARLVK